MPAADNVDAWTHPTTVRSIVASFATIVAVVKNRAILTAVATATNTSSTKARSSSTADSVVHASGTRGQTRVPAPTCNTLRARTPSVETEEAVRVAHAHVVSVTVSFARAHKHVGRRAESLTGNTKGAVLSADTRTVVAISSVGAREAPGSNRALYFTS